VASITAARDPRANLASADSPRFILSYFWLVFAAAAITSIVDALLIVPMVEVDPALTIKMNRSPVVEQVRATAPAVGSIASILLVTLSFPVAGESVVYYATSAVAIVSTGLFGFLLSYTLLTEVNRRSIIPVVFPDGGVSRSDRVRPIGLPAKLMSLCFAVGLFPLIVLALGTYTRSFVPANELRAYLFILLYAPVSGFLAYRTGQSLQGPLGEIVTATRQIAAGDFSVKLRSAENDELGYLTDSTIEMARSLEDKQLLSDTFGRVVDPRVRDHLLAGNIELGGSRSDAAVLFCDIRGFTAYSENRSEEEVVRMLNEHLFEMDRAVSAHRGMINKFMGDGLLAVFGLPLAIDEPCSAALRCALDMVAANSRLNDHRRTRGEEELRLGVGLHYGAVIAGNVGSPTRMEYTVIGDAVNLASRVQGLTKRVESEIIVTSELASRLPHELREQGALWQIGSVRVRGRSEAVEVWGANQ
jgi:adenylate cyclase